MRGIRWLSLVAISLLLAGCGSAAKRAALRATPQHVVADYFAAVNAHDKAQARLRVTPGFARSFDDPHSCLFDGCAKITHLKTSKPRYDRNGADVPVRFIIVDQRDQGAKPDAYSGYYCLSRTGPHAPWLIDDEGDC